MTFNIETSQLLLILAFVTWELFWKGIALWRASQRKQPYWFTLLLISNTVGAIPILYLLYTEQIDEVPDDQYLEKSTVQ